MKESPGMDRRIFLSTLFACAIALAIPATSGAVTLGSLAPTVSPGSGCGSCNMVQIGTNSAAPSYETPSTGIITSYSMRTSTVTAADKVALMLTYQKTSTGYLLKHLGEQLPIPATSANSVVTFKVHVPVESGWLLGVSGTTSNTPMVYIPEPFQSGSLTGGFATLPTGSSTSTINGTPTDGHLLNLAVNFEADADGDGFGDETEDCFPADPTRHGVCPDVTAPVLSGLKSKYAKFRVNSKGALVAKSTPKGTTLSLQLSESATTRFTVERAVKNKGRTTYKAVHTFSRPLLAGANLIKYSGRFRDAKKKKKSLTPGKYRLTATPVDAAGNVGLPVSTKYTIVK